jgi:hypothetical protein
MYFRRICSPRSLTLKGREFSEEQVAKCFYSVKKLSTNMIQMLANKDPTEHIRIEYIDWMQGYELFMNLHNKHLLGFSISHCNISFNI